MRFKIPLLILITLQAVFLLSITSFAGGRVKEKPRPTVDQYNFIRMADNFFVLYDPSTAMTVPYKNTGMTRLEVMRKILVESNASAPELKWQAGLYPHWKNVMWLPSSPESFHPYYRLQNYNKDEYGLALEELPIISSGPPMLQIALMKMEYLLDLPGRTEIFLFTNGEDARFKGVEEPEPLAQAKMLAANHNICLTIVSSATTDKAKKLLYDMAKVNTCSQVIDFDTVVEHPEYLFGKLYMGVDGLFGDVLFDFDKAYIKNDYRKKLDVVGRFLKKHRHAYTVLSGFTDSVGPETYNIGLSQRRAESAQRYLINKYHIKKDRVLLYWYGLNKPVAPNTTAEGRQRNRRVTIIIREKV